MNNKKNDMFYAGEKKKITLPDDCAEIKRRIMLRDGVKIILTLLWYVAVVLYYIYDMKKMLNADTFNIISVCYIALLLAVPFLLFRVHRVFTDRSYEAVITEIKIKTVSSIDKAAVGRSTVRRSNKIQLKIKTDKGIIKKVLISGGQYVKIGYYKIGDRVRHYHGVQYLHDLDYKPHTEVSGKKQEIPCLWCGSFNFSGETRCYSCKTKIIK